jgi:hypothetical protein
VTVQKDTAVVALTAANRGTQWSRDFQADLDIKSTFRFPLHTVRVSTSHTDDGNQYRENLQVTLNQDAYSYVMNSDVRTGGLTGDVTFSWPQNHVSWKSMKN